MMFASRISAALGDLRLRPSRTAAAAALLLVAIGLSLVPLGAVYQGSGHVGPLALALGLAGAIAAAAWLFRVPWWLSVISQLVAFSTAAGVTLFAASPGSGVPVWSTVSAVWAGAVSGRSEMLSLPLPLEPSGELLILPFLAVWVTAVASVDILLRSVAVEAPERRRPALALVPAIGLVALFASLGPNGRPDAPAVAGLIGCAVFVLWLTTGHEIVDGARSARWAALAGLPLILVAALVGGSILRTDSLTDQDRWDPRADFDPLVERHDLLSPLAMVKALVNDDGDTPHLSIRFDAGAPVGSQDLRIRVAALDEFDGALWQSDAQFIRVTRDLAPTPDAPVGAAGQGVRARIELSDDYPFQYLPTLGAPQRIDGPSLGHDPASETLLHDGVTAAGQSYVLTSTLSPEIGELAGRSLMAATTDADLGRYRTLPGTTPSAVEAFLVEAADGQATATMGVDELLAIIDTMRGGDFAYETRNAHGHSYAAVAQYLGTTELDGPQTPVRTGFGEQAASAFAVLARAEGYPARVAVGYQVDADRVATAVGDDATLDVLPADAHAWAEVYVDDIGWVAVDPVDRAASTEEPPQLPSVDDDLVDEPEDDPVTADEQPLVLPPPPVEPGRGPSLWWLALPAVALLAPAIAVAKWFRRRSRRRATTPAARTWGAWQESLDRLVEFGVPTSPAATPMETIAGAEASGVLTVDHRTRRLAALAGTAAWYPELADDDSASTAWDDAEALRTMLVEHHDRRSRIRSIFDPRPLLPASWTMASEAPPHQDPFGARETLLSMERRSIEALLATTASTAPHRPDPSVTETIVVAADDIDLRQPPRPDTDPKPDTEWSAER